ncbi:Zinc finger protein gcs1 [Rasamsonia emersonii CBS 393.64]|uniref:Zinc finger protein gcs1 n=1 Tax=Rasamsonia emersonii (strain ATCC 16479 / CBS 393.64 / IMI 116815) TaxID=1408163 RepID=A0A0F4YWD6_RASE3|nr:Zinc finger protein gcs1 [Rasamsonia emersonii CBS 393.64]KKA21943.1 Zinc finger protein gcs1 [Rasamsonia emersonii CBS 393.64]
MSKMWEVDPETRAKISKTNGNDRCCDCGAPSPQWASPKFGTFICLNCAGTHRGLGVHISFVRSITMDAFKTSELKRMEHGGNDTWKTFYDEHPITISEGRTFEDSTIKERYDGEVGEEYKERLTAKVEGREYVPGERKKKQPTNHASSESYSSRSSTPLQGGRASPAATGGLDGSAASRKERNEAYFAKLGSENAARREDLPPSQGGKYTGFGGGMPVSSGPARSQNGGALSGVPGLDDFQKDPVGALTKGLGWFTSAVGKGAKTVNETYIQPTAKSLAETDFAAQARQTAVQLGQNLQTSARGAAESLNRFVEGADERAAAVAARRRGFEPERKEFWDNFASLGAGGGGRQERPASGALGTTAMKKSPSPFSSSSAASSTATAATPAATGLTKTTTTNKGNNNDEWSDDW